MRRAVNHRLSWRIGAVSIGTMALGVVGTGTGAAATGCEDCGPSPSVQKDADCSLSGTVKVRADKLPLGETGRDLVSGAQNLVPADCRPVQLDVGGDPSADPASAGVDPRTGERRPSDPRRRDSGRQAIPEPRVHGTDPGGIPTPRGTHFGIPTPRGAHFSVPDPKRSDVRLPAVAKPARVANVANSEDTGQDGAPWLIAIAAATAGVVGGANLALLAVRRRESGTA